MATKREIIRDAGVVAILSVGMAVILAFAWVAAYGTATGIEERLLEEIPVLDENGIQAVALFGLGVFVAWTVMLSQDFRKRLQGQFLLVGVVLALGVMAYFDVFLPNMDPTAVNLGAFLLGLVAAAVPELFATRLNDGRNDLLYLDLSESSWGRAVRTKDGETELAQFNAARRGLFLILVLIAFAAVLILMVAGESGFLIAAGIVVSAVFAAFLYRLFNRELTPPGIEILGPSKAGKSTFLYGCDLTLERNDRFSRLEASPEWEERVAEAVQERNEPNGNPWGVPGTTIEDAGECWIEFVDMHGYWQKGRIGLYDYPGQYIDDLAARTDGGSSTQTDGEESPDLVELTPGYNYWNALVDAGYESPEEVLELSTEQLAEIVDLEQDERDSHDVAKEIHTNISNELRGRDDTTRPDIEREGQDDATDSDEAVHRDSPEDDPEQDGDTDTGPGSESQGQRENITAEEIIATMDERLSSANIIICTIDTEAVIKSGYLQLDKYPEETESGGKKDPVVGKLNSLCKMYNPDDVIVVATKSDLLIDQYLRDDPGPDDTYEPHMDDVGDFGEFTDWVRQQFNVNAMPGNFTPDDGYPLYPVYYRTREDDGQMVPVENDDGELMPEGFEQVIEAMLS